VLFFSSKITSALDELMEEAYEAGTAPQRRRLAKNEK
jgi:hypothetical protein